MERLKKLTALRGVSGFEDEVRAYVLQEAEELADEVRVDALGSVIALKKGTEHPEKVVMVAAHMDEVGFIITSVEDRGTLRFATVGGIDSRVLQSKRVLIGEKRVPGVIGSMAIHLLEAKDMGPLKVNQLYIDIGCTSKAEAEALVKPGDTAVFDSDFVTFGDGLVKCRALDDRVGCGVLLSALEQRYPVTLAAVFTVQEEIGCKGATAAAFAVNPDAGIVLEGTTCADMHGVDEGLKVTRIGQGPVVSIMDRAAIPNRPFREFVTAAADEYGIPWQYRQGAFGGTDAGALQRAKGGRPVANIAVATRYIHSPVNVISQADYLNAQTLLKRVLERMDRFLEVE